MLILMALRAKILSILRRSTSTICLRVYVMTLQLIVRRWLTLLVLNLSQFLLAFVAFVLTAILGGVRLVDLILPSSRKVFAGTAPRRSLAGLVNLICLVKCDCTHRTPENPFTYWAFKKLGRQFEGYRNRSMSVSVRMYERAIATVAIEVQALRIAKLSVGNIGRCVSPVGTHEAAQIGREVPGPEVIQPGLGIPFFAGETARRSVVGVFDRDFADANHLLTSLAANSSG